ncbi:hypothetical protein IJJ39_01145 [Candidatus Saccharibacteria bacterium]|nr:hypothetical protein [Candidatus Saccharibacteria bacterium]
MRRLKNIVILGITLVAIGATAVGTGVGALEYKSNTIPLTFQFDTTMTVSLSGSSLVIDELSPNTAKNSNTVDVTVVTNDVTGYTLKATTGDASNTTTNLVAENGTFGMIGSGENALSVGKWGYTIDGGTTFGALALYTATPTTVNASNAPTDATTGKTAFQIGAYASPSQAAGDYTNVVNFIAVANSVVTDGTYMQDVTSQSLATMLPNVGDKTTLYDKRDNQAYKVAKLADGKYWMTSNLNLAGGTTVTSADSDVTTNFTLPESSNSPDFSSDTAATVYNSNSTYCGDGSPCYSYYSYVAATAGTGSSVTDNGYNASGSICPKGWRLPTATTSDAAANSNNNWETGDFWLMATQYGMPTSSYYENPDNPPTFLSLAGPGTTPNFLLSGYFNGTSFSDGGSYGYYWSSTVNGSSYAYDLFFGSGSVYPADYSSRRRGFPVRCLFGA